MQANSSPVPGKTSGIPLLVLALPAALVVVTWLLERADIFPEGSRAAGLNALFLILGSFLSLWPIFVVVRRLIQTPAIRGLPHFALLAISLVTLVPAVAFAIWS
jgi:hypothetical protein